MTRPVRVQNDRWDSEVNSIAKDTDEDETGSYMEGYSSDDKTYDYKFKICLLGDAGVGKTSLIKRYISNKFTDDTDDNRNVDDELNFSTVKPTIGVDCMTTVRVMRGHKIAIELWDTAGQERFNALTTSYLRSANAIILVYDITNRVSFEELEKRWLEFVKTNIPMNAYGGFDARIAIVANKLDLNDDRVVPKKDGVKLAQLNFCRFFEASAKSGRNVKELFRSICDSICDYWCDLRGNPTFFPADVDTKNIRLNSKKQSKPDRNRSNCVKC